MSSCSGARLPLIGARRTPSAAGEVLFPAVLIEVRCSVLHPRVLGRREQSGAQGCCGSPACGVQQPARNPGSACQRGCPALPFFPWISTALPSPPPRPAPSPWSVCPQQPLGQGSAVEPRVPRPRVVFTLRDVDVLAVIPAPRRARAGPDSTELPLAAPLAHPPHATAPCRESEPPRAPATVALALRRVTSRAGAHPGGGWRGWGCRPCAGASLATKDHDPPLLHSRQSMYRACSFHIAENLRAFFYFWSLYIMDLNNKERFRAGLGETPSAPPATPQHPARGWDRTGGCCSIPAPILALCRAGSSQDIFGSPSRGSPRPHRPGWHSRSPKATGPLPPTPVPFGPGQINV